MDARHHGPWVEREHGGWTLRLLVGDGPLTGFLDVEVRWGATLLTGTMGTTADIADRLARYRSSGEGAGGRYFWTADLVVLDELTEAAAFDALADLVDSGELWAALDPPRDRSGPVTG